MSCSCEKVNLGHGSMPRYSSFVSGFFIAIGDSTHKGKYKVTMGEGNGISICIVDTTYSSIVD